MYCLFLIKTKCLISNNFYILTLPHTLFLKLLERYQSPWDDVQYFISILFIFSIFCSMLCMFIDFVLKNTALVWYVEFPVISFLYFQKICLSSKNTYLVFIAVWFSLFFFSNVYNVHSNLSENVIRIFFKFSYVHWITSVSSSHLFFFIACFFAFSLSIFLNSLMIYSWYFTIKKKGLDGWIKVAVTPFYIDLDLFFQNILPWNEQAVFLFV